MRASTRRYLVRLGTLLATLFSLKVQQTILLSGQGPKSWTTSGSRYNKTHIETTTNHSVSFPGTLVLERRLGETDKDFVQRFPIDADEYDNPDFLRIARESRQADGLVFYPRAQGNIKVRLFKKTDASPRLPEARNR